MPDLDLQEQYGYVSLIQISPQNLDINGPKAFYTLMDELERALKEDKDDGLYHNRTALLKAYTDGCLYGLYIPLNEETPMKNREIMASDDPIFMTNRYSIDRMLACCIVIDKEYNYMNTSVCHYLWTARRARNNGLATNLLDEVLVDAAEDILPEAQAFWTKYFARMKVARDGDEVMVSNELT